MRLLLRSLPITVVCILIYHSVCFAQNDPVIVSRILWHDAEVAEALGHIDTTIPRLERAIDFAQQLDPTRRMWITGTGEYGLVRCYVALKNREKAREAAIKALENHFWNIEMLSKNDDVRAV